MIQPTLQSATNRTSRPNPTTISLWRMAPTSPCHQWRRRSVDKDHCVAFPLRGSTCVTLFSSFHLLILSTVQRVQAGQLVETPRSNKAPLLSTGVLTDHFFSADTLSAVKAWPSRPAIFLDTTEIILLGNTVLFIYSLTLRVYWH